MGSGGGWEHSCSSSLHFKDSVSRISGKKGNFSINICKVNGTLFC